MNSVYYAVVLTVLFRCLYSSDNQLKGECHSPQYVEYGKVGLVNCEFPKDIIGVLWYNTTDYATHDPIIHYRNMIKTGAGYKSGDYDVQPNGSLIIRNVSLHHNITFHVAIVYSQEGVPYVIDVVVIVLRKPLTAFPVLNKCGDVSNTCYIKIGSPFIQCSVSDTQPSVFLGLVVRTVAGDKNVSNDMSVTSDGQWYTSRVTTTNVFYYSPRLSLLVCKASSLPGMLANNESLILVQNNNVDLSLFEKMSLYFERTARMELNCTEDKVGFLVWKKATSLKETEHEVLFYSVFIGQPFKETFSEGTTIGSKGEVIVPLVDVSHEGLYYCIYGDGDSDGVAMYDVSVIVYPVPAYPVINGCNERQLCTVNVEREGNLTCMVKGIRPQVQLEWKTLSVSDVPVISFSNQQETVKTNKDTFDVTLTTTYSVQDELRDRLIIECTVAEQNQALFNLKTNLNLYFTKASIDTNEVVHASSHKILWVIITVAVLIFVASATAVVVIKKYMGKQRKSKLQKEIIQLGEQLPMFPGAMPMEEGSQPFEIDTDKEGKRKLLINQLREKYRDLYDAVQPIPYIQDRLYCVDKIFVEGGIQLLERSVGTEDNWTNLVSYVDMFNDSLVNFNRLILEGDPGYGKSTVTLQIAYDWCNHKEISKLKDADILILLRLRQLGGVHSIFKAIKYFLLPRDSQLKEKDIQEILMSSESVVVILDGYDEYPDQDKQSDFMEIFSRNMFQQFQVILTTRSSYLPKQYAPQTKRVRLTGFDENAQELYICKAVVGEDNDAIEKLKNQIKENPVLSGLCEVPLFFVMFAHMLHESDSVLNFNSVTTFFRHMIACFHEHMKNKMAEKNVKKSKLFQNEHQKLDKVAFDGLCRKDQNIVWMKEELRKKIGKKFYDAYIRVGILVEEEVLHFMDKPDTELIVRKIEVRFYHKLFCEWYAAHFLSRYASQLVSYNLGNIVQEMDPFDLQYVYRFACGLNPRAADKIIKRLSEFEGGDKFAILCIMEQSGNLETIKETIRDLCSEGVIISGHDSKLLQRSYVQLLQIAAKNDISIRLVTLHNCFQSVELTSSSITTTSGLTLNSRIPFNQLNVNLYNREITAAEVIEILEFSSLCPSLNFLWFTGSVPPQSFKVDSTLSMLKSRNIEVKWNMFKDDPDYILNLETGRWEEELNGKEPSAEKIEEMRSRFANYHKRTTEENERRQINNIRKTLSEYAEKRRENTSA